MSNKTGVFAENLSVTSNVLALTIKSLGKISDQQVVENSETARTLMAARILQRLGSQLRNKQIEG